MGLTTGTLHICKNINVVGWVEARNPTREMLRREASVGLEAEPQTDRSQGDPGNEGTGASRLRAEMVENKE